MNLPNKLTVMRMALIPVFLVFMLVESIQHRYLIAAVIFAAASFTDYLDGHIARRDGLVTNFGKLMDPLADKLLVFSALVCFIELEMSSALIVFIILAREFLVTSVRLIAAEQGTVIAADIWGKMKTVSQIIWVLVALIALWLEESWPLFMTVSPGASAPPAPVIFLIGLSFVIQTIVVILTVFSGFNYIWKNRSLLGDIK
ncbi:CDP-diacylglycerol--glycerol-3-phosphate 3-phosphatidyltransferase [Anaerotruncus colihominis]|uniref:CDP-diacylglycerol--glycerol-3-phosphate 3-phosphatidyltransferase n=1 Tax=Anaerotruncus colihominis TaxID=169435 RepID=UPI0026721E52|nr:CDP-diacylglycerol--glycerol-3-phosphate 3-phosphatidyltransferase [Anaerotruncus colihominis]